MSIIVKDNQSSKPKSLLRLLLANQIIDLNQNHPLDEVNIILSCKQSKVIQSNYTKHIITDDNEREAIRQKDSYVGVFLAWGLDKTNSVAQIFHHGRERTKDLLITVAINTSSLKGECLTNLSQTRKQDISLNESFPNRK